MENEISYKLDSYEGPLDVLLRLIENDKINIYDIPIAKITNQYLEYMSRMEETDLNIMSEFLVMAATLLDIKARMLLPKEIDEETGEEIDPRADLVQRLIEHKKYKMMAEELHDMLFDSEKRLYKDPTVPKEVVRYQPPVNLDELFGNVTLSKLQSIFDEVMKKKEERIDPERSKFGTIKKEKISIAEKLTGLVKYANKHKTFSFKNLLEEQPTKLEVVVTFLAILELTKAGRLLISQSEEDGDINIVSVEQGDKEKELDLSGLEDFES